MNSSRLLNTLVIGLALVVGGAGCKKKPEKGVTNIPGQRAGGGLDTTRGAPISQSPIVPLGSDTASSRPLTTEIGPEGVAQVGNPDDIDRNFTKDPDMFKANTVYFDFDSPAIKAKERVKIEEVATYMKSSTGAANKLLVEGNCDERGTEEYNRALGERRALAVREYLVRLGVSGDRVYTRSYGEDRPSMTGHDEGAWSKNRRGDFVVLKPK